MRHSYELLERDSTESWRALRSRRAAPPPAAARGHRAETFRSSLEQAEQQFRAASNTGYESRALNLFYGLSQAGRAIAAASPLLKDDYNLSGHGITTHKLDSMRANLDDVAVTKGPGEPASFPAVSRALGSPNLVGPVRLSEVWPLLLGTSTYAPYGDAAIALALVTVDKSVDLLGQDSASVQIAGPIDVDRDLATTIDKYPQLSGWTRNRPSGESYDWTFGSSGVQLTWMQSGGSMQGSTFESRLSTYRGKAVAIPAVGGMGTQLEPVMTWWIVLYALSMVTRYQPAAWTTLIDVNSSAHATVIEYVLDLALDAVPDLIDEAIGLASTAPNGTASAT